MQEAQHMEAKQKLIIHWREYIHSEIHGNLKDVEIFKLYSDEKSDYEGGYLQK